MEQGRIFVIGTSENKKSLIHLRAVYRKGLMLGTVGSQTSAVLVDVLIVQLLVVVPDAAEAIGFLVYELGSREAGVRVNFPDSLITSLIFSLRGLK